MAKTAQMTQFATAANDRQPSDFVSASMIRTGTSASVAASTTGSSGVWTRPDSSWLHMGGAFAVRAIYPSRAGWWAPGTFAIAESVADNLTDYVLRLAAITAVMLVAPASGTARAHSTTSTAGSCRTVPSAVITAIQVGMNHGARLRAVRAVRSADFRSVYLVSADLQGPGLGGNSQIATFALNRLRIGTLIFSANSVAKRFSDWGGGPGFSSADDGFRQSQRCVRRALS